MLYSLSTETPLAIKNQMRRIESVDRPHASPIFSNLRGPGVAHCGCYGLEKKLKFRGGILSPRVDQSNRGPVNLERRVDDRRA